MTLRDKSEVDEKAVNEGDCTESEEDDSNSELDSCEVVSAV